MTSGGPAAILRLPADHQTGESSSYAAQAGLHDIRLSGNQEQLAEYAVAHLLRMGRSFLALSLPDDWSSCHVHHPLGRRRC